MSNVMIHNRINQNRDTSSDMHNDESFKQMSSVRLDASDSHISLASIYTAGPPLRGIVGVSEFYDFVVARLQILQLIDKICGPNQSVDAVKSDQIQRAIKANMPSDQSSLVALLLRGRQFTAAHPVSRKRMSIGTSIGANTFGTYSARGSIPSGQEPSSKQASTPNVNRFDKISHFSLRLAFSQDVEKQAWFILQESRLLMLRLCLLRETVKVDCLSTPEHLQDSQGSSLSLTDSSASLASFLQSAATQDFLRCKGDAFQIVDCRGGENGVAVRELLPNFNIVTLPNDSEIRNLIQRSSAYGDAVQFAVKVPFWPYGAPLVRKRHCFLAGGFAYVPLQDLDTLVVQQLRRNLIASFAILKDRDDIIQKSTLSDVRLSPLFRAIERDFSTLSGMKPSESAPCERVTPQNISTISKRSFPPCMRRVYNTLKEKGHLKYHARLQLWLFLKSCGMSVDEQLLHWKSLWAEPDKFDKQHKYGIRHCYGLEGKRLDHTSYACSKVINGLPPPINTGDAHGCPFKTMDTPHLRQLLQSYNVTNTQDIESITHLAEERHYELSCIQFFKYMHPRSLGDGLGHSPHVFYKESCNYWADSNLTTNAPPPRDK